MTAIITALVAAIFYGVGAAVEQHQAATVPGNSTGRPHLLMHLIRQPLWLAGLGAQGGGFILQAIALRFGDLAVVQMLVATSLIVSVIVVRIWSGRSLSWTTWAAATTVVTGVATFLVLTTMAPGAGGRRAAHGPGHQAMAAVALLAIVTIAVTVTGLRAVGPHRAGLLGTAAGVIDTAMAVVTMTFTHIVGLGPVAVVTSWSTYALIACGTASLQITQTAYQANHPLITLPLISAVTPAASVAVGFGILGETFHLGITSVVGAGLAVVSTSIALAVLAHSASAHAGGHSPVSARPPGRPGTLECADC